MTDDKALEAARARVRLLEQTISELRTQLSTRAAPGKGATGSDRDVGEARPRRHSLRSAAVRPEPGPEVAELKAALDARQRDLEVCKRERDEARAASSRRESEVEALRNERDAARAALNKRDSESEALRVERDDARTKLRAVEQERDQARSRAAGFEAQLEAERAERAKVVVRPTKRNTAELESQNLRVQALERQLEALRVAWKASDERAQGLETKLRQVRSLDTAAIVRAAAERAGELAKLLEAAAATLKLDDSIPRL